MLDPVAISLGAALTLIVVTFHFLRGSERQTPSNIADEVLERRAATVLPSGFPEPMSRAIGAGSGGVAAIPGGAGTEGELAEGAEVEETAAGPGDIPEDEIEYFEIEFSKEGKTIEVANNETLLDAGEDEGWDLPYACREGQCISCGGRISGDARELVAHDDQTMLDDDELSEGYVLTCVAYPRGAFTLETNEAP